MSVYTTEYIECIRIVSQNCEYAFPIASTGFMRVSFDKEHPSIKSICLFKITWIE